jgi:hypothetical protein
VSADQTDKPEGRPPSDKADRDWWLRVRARLARAIRDSGGGRLDAARAARAELSAVMREMAEERRRGGAA